MELDQEMLEMLRGIAPGVLQEYLRNRGWSLAEDLSAEGLVIYRSGDDIVEVPLRQDFADYARRIAEVVEPVAELERVRPHALIEQLLEPVGDVLAVRVKSPLAAGGTLPLLEAIKAREGAKNLLLAAAHSALLPQSYFARMSRPSAVSLIASVHETQTQRGSFICRFIVPTTPAVGQLSLDADADPFGRQVVKLLMRALDRVRHVRSLGAYDELLSMEAQGVSGNLLGALAAMRPLGGDLDLSVSWSRNRKPPTEVVSKVMLSEEALRGLEAVAEEMSRRAQTQGFEVVGYVTRLERQLTYGPGDVIVVPTSGQDVEFARVSVRLDATRYEEAIKAHAQGTRVRILGTLGKDGRRWTVADASAFELHPEPPIES